ncbi:MAG: hypothetical protein AABZ44_03310, partial [Elusimicrobiota bacterium]
RGKGGVDGLKGAVGTASKGKGKGFQEQSGYTSAAFQSPKNASTVNTPGMTAPVTSDLKDTTMPNDLKQNNIACPNKGEVKNAQGVCTKLGSNKNEQLTDEHKGTKLTISIMILAAAGLGVALALMSKTTGSGVLQATNWVWWGMYAALLATIAVIFVMAKGLMGSGDATAVAAGSGFMGSAAGLAVGALMMLIDSFKSSAVFAFAMSGAMSLIQLLSGSKK